MELPKVKFMLLSVINMKLRDQYGSLDALCDDMDVDKGQLIADLEQIGYTYDKTLNSFK